MSESKQVTVVAQRPAIGDGFTAGHSTVLLEGSALMRDVTAMRINLSSGMIVLTLTRMCLDERGQAIRDETAEGGAAVTRTETYGLDSLLAHGWRLADENGNPK